MTTIKLLIKRASIGSTGDGSTQYPSQIQMYLGGENKDENNLKHLRGNIYQQVQT